MKNRIIQILCLLTMFVGLFTVTVFADMGPKPSVNLKIRGLHGTEYFVTLLSETDTTGPYSVFDPSYSQPPEEYRDVWQKFVDYQDEDGFYFLQYFQRVEEKEDRDGIYGDFSWTYYPPERFKILIYFQGTDTFLCSDEVIETYAFDSYFEVFPDTVKGTCSVEKSYGFGWEVFAFLVRLILTIAIELVVAVLFGFRDKRLLKVIFFVNVVTQLGLNIALLVTGYMSIFFFYVLYYGIAELIVLYMEGEIYHRAIIKFNLQHNNALHPYWYSLTANLCSFLLGYVISHWFPFVF